MSAEYPTTLATPSRGYVPVAPKKYTCGRCGKAFERKGAKQDGRPKHCSVKCRSGYQSRKVRVACKVCGKEFVATARARTCSTSCRGKDCARRCVSCGQTFRGCQSQNFCSEACRPAINCGECGRPFVPCRNSGFLKYCSQRCAARYHHAARKAAKKRLFVEHVPIRFLFDRDGGKCQICRAALSIETEYPDPLFATVDHVIPLSKEGEHSKANTQLACLRCNVLKNDRVETLF